MYAGPWRHVRSLTVSATCVALSAAGHLAGGGVPARSRPRQGRRAARRVAGLLAVCALAVTGVLGSLVTSAAPASAHASLVRATPADGATLTSAPAQVVLQFDDPISTSFATLVVTGPDGHDVTTGKPTVSGSTADRRPGGWTGSWRLPDRLPGGQRRRPPGERAAAVHPPAAGDGLAVGQQPPPVSGTPSAQPSPTSGATTPAGPTDTGQSVVPGSAPASPAAPPAEGSSWFAANLLPLSGVLVMVVIGAGALLWDRQRH